MSKKLLAAFAATLVTALVVWFVSSESSISGAMHVDRYPVDDAIAVAVIATNDEPVDVVPAERHEVPIVAAPAVDEPEDDESSAEQVEWIPFGKLSEAIRQGLARAAPEQDVSIDTLVGMQFDKVDVDYAVKYTGLATEQWTPIKTLRDELRMRDKRLGTRIPASSFESEDEFFEELERRKNDERLWADDGESEKADEHGNTVTDEDGYIVMEAYIYQLELDVRPDLLLAHQMERSMRDALNIECHRLASELLYRAVTHQPQTVEK